MYSKKNILYLSALFLLLLLPTIFAFFTAIDIQASLFKRLAFLFLVILLLAIPATFLKARAYFLIEGIFNFLFFPIDIVSLYLNGQSTSKAFLENIYNTNIGEAIELLSMFWYLVIIVVALWVLYFWLAFQVKNERIIPAKIAKYILGLTGSSFVILFIAMMTLILRVHNERTIGVSIRDAFELVGNKFYKIYPYNLYIETADIISERATNRRLAKEVSSFQFGIPKMEQPGDELYLFVLGETARYDHFGFNGYNRPTTPYLDQRSNFISYDSVFSQANLTANSVPLLISRANVQQPEVAYREKCIVEAFQEAGFAGGWLTKQIPNPFIRRIMGACNYAYYYAKGMEVEGNYDMEMIDKLREWNQDTAQFIVLHTLGNHFRYSLRYPKEFEVFQPALGEDFNYAMIAESNKELFVNAYDNALLYTDYFLNELINYVDSLNKVAAICYISDHGESFWDDERKMSLHGSYQVSEFEYHVPMLIWYSDEYAARYPQKVATMTANKSKLIASDVMFHSLLDLAGITALVDSTKSFCSPYLQERDTIYVMTGSGEVLPWRFRKE